jgi:hypothetical protein
MSDRGFTEGVRIVNGFRIRNTQDGFYMDADSNSLAAGSDFVSDVWNIMDSAGNLLIKKHKDYGPKNISQSPGGPLNGLRVRMWDKTARINHLIDSGATPENESLRDSFLDLLNYSAIAMMVLDNSWPKE